MADLDPTLLRRWGVAEPVLIAETATSRVSRVRLADGGTAVIKDLKPIGAEEELRGAKFLAWRDGHGCVRLLARSGSTWHVEDGHAAKAAGSLGVAAAIHSVLRA